MIKHTALTTAAILCTFSVVASVGLFASTAPDTLSQIIAGTIALGLELAKFTFIPVGLTLLTQGRQRAALGATLLALGAAALVVSIAATVGFLDNNMTANGTAATQQNIAHQTLKNKLASLQTQINTNTQIAARYASINHGARALETQATINTLEQQRDTTLAQLQALSVKPAGQMAAAITTANQLTGTDTTATTWLTLAILVDLCGLAAIILYNQSRKEENETRDPGLNKIYSDFKKIFHNKVIKFAKDKNLGEPYQSDWEKMQASLDVGPSKRSVAGNTPKTKPPILHESTPEGNGTVKLQKGETLEIFNDGKRTQKIEGPAIIPEITITTNNDWHTTLEKFLEIRLDNYEPNTSFLLENVIGIKKPTNADRLKLGKTMRALGYETKRQGRSDRVWAKQQEEATA